MQQTRSVFEQCGKGGASNYAQSRLKGYIDGGLGISWLRACMLEARLEDGPLEHHV